MLYSVCPACQHHNRVAFVGWDSIPPDWSHSYTCTVCSAVLTASASNSYIVRVKSSKGPGPRF